MNLASPYGFRHIITLAMAVTWSSGCGDKQTGATDRSTQPPETTTTIESTWILAGLMGQSPSNHPLPAEFSEGAQILAHCQTANRPKNRKPCVAEEWRNRAGKTRLHLRMGRKTLIVDPESLTTEANTPPSGVSFMDTWSGQWTRINGVLSECLGDPMSIPPAQDIDGFRVLETVQQGDEAASIRATWLITLSGSNRCGLTGTLQLDAKGSRINPREIRCDNQPWKNGGLDCARKTLQAEIRTTVEELWESGEWNALSEKSRVIYVRGLSNDPLAAGLLMKMNQKNLLTDETNVPQNE